MSEKERERRKGRVGLTISVHVNSTTTIVVRGPAGPGDSVPSLRALRFHSRLQSIDCYQSVIVNTTIITDRMITIRKKKTERE